MDGWLSKLGGKGIKKNWRRRWFALTYDKYLYYYKTDQVRILRVLLVLSLTKEQDEDPTGVICLDDYCAVTSLEDTKKKFHFKLHADETSTVRVFRFCTETQKEQLQWMSAIEQVFRVGCLPRHWITVVDKSFDRLPRLITLARRL